MKMNKGAHRITKFYLHYTKRMWNKTMFYIPVKQMFCTWMKTLLHCGFG